MVSGVIMKRMAQMMSRCKHRPAECVHGVVSVFFLSVICMTAAGALLQISTVMESMGSALGMAFWASGKNWDGYISRCSSVVGIAIS